MRVAITGGTGFLGRHLARDLVKRGHAVILVARGRRPLPVRTDGNPALTFERATVTDRPALREAFEGCEAVAHFAGINYERGEQTYDAVHRRGTEAVVAAADDRGVERLVLSSYLRARPTGENAYLTSKWDAETAVRAAPMTTTVLKPAAIFGEGDQLLTNLARWLLTVPVAPRVGISGPLLRPVAVEDVATAASAALVGEAMQDETVVLLGPEALALSTLIDRIGEAIGRRIFTVPAPVTGLRLGGRFFERAVHPPVVTRAGVDMLAEGMTAPAPAHVCSSPPAAFAPDRSPTVDVIEDAVSGVSRYGRGDLAV